MEKLKYIKMFLGTILTVLLIISMFKSCCYAYTYDDFVEFIEDTKTLGNSAGQTLANYFLENRSRLESEINVNDYTTFVISGGTVSGTASTRNVVILALNFSSNPYWHYSSGSYSIMGNLTNGKQITIYPSSTTTRVTDKQNSIAIGNGTTGIRGLIEGLTGTYQKTDIYILQNYYNYFDLLGAENRNIDLLPWYFANSRVGGQYYNNELSFKLYDINDNFIKYLNAVNKTETQAGYQYQLEIPNTSGITNGNLYRVKYNDNTSDFFTSEDFIISWQRQPQNGEITNSSGEVTGNINLNETNNKIDNISNKIEQQNEVIKSGDEKIINAIKEAESGEKERQTFWEKAYNDLFTVSGDYIESKINEIMQEYSFSGDIEAEKAFLDLINSNYDDFKISWGNMTTHFTINGQNIPQLTIPSGEINFSKLERENEELKESMKWVRIILGFSVGALILKNCWSTLMHTLGVGIQVYDKNKDESEKLNITNNKDKK